MPVKRIKHLLRTGAGILKPDVVVIGSGISGLSAAAMLTAKDMKVLVLEANYLPGGCTSSYYRQGYWLEAGATTLVGLDEGMPLKYVLDETGIELKTWQLDMPMQVHMNGRTLTRHQNLEKWITEANKYFGEDQTAFWRECDSIARSVWHNATKLLHFPPENISDLGKLLRSAELRQISQLPNALWSTESLLEKHGLNKEPFKSFVNEQLMITAQNPAHEVNRLFGAAALCYTNYSNHYVPGGMINMIGPFIEYLIANGSDYRSRQAVTQIKRSTYGYEVITDIATYTTPLVISALPVNNTVALLDNINTKPQTILKADKLYSAFQLSLAFRSDERFDCIHHQIHVDKEIAGLYIGSIFLSMSHPDDDTRSNDGAIVASVSTHIRKPDPSVKVDGDTISKAVIKILEHHGFLRTEDVLHQHWADADSWLNWTRRAFGSVGGYPQQLKIKPWAMNASRLAKGLYICGDTTYPGQGIPGASLSGIIAAEKLWSDTH